MHETTEAEAPSRPRWIVPMRARSPQESHRAATPLELFFDLVFVVAVSQAAVQLHHAIAEGHGAEAGFSFGLLFFGIWWAWMNFTWFASSFDINDIPYRLVIFVQMTGALIFASGIEAAFTEFDLRVAVLGYIVMRVASVIHWLRAAWSDPRYRPASLRYAAGTVAVQVAWIGLLFVPEQYGQAVFVVLAIIELLIPVWAEAASPTPWHPHHIVERYGLFTVLVLGESILSTSVAIRSALDEDGMTGNLTSIILGALLIVYSLWWLYFYQPVYHFMDSMRAAFVWAYGHFFIFGVTAAVGAGLAVVIDYVTHHAEISAQEAGMAVALPVAIYVLSLWILQEHSREKNWFDWLVHPVTAGLILLTPFMEQTVLLTGILLAVLVAIRLVRHLE
jgi:low temperature requirement protein LtrA